MSDTDTLAEISAALDQDGVYVADNAASWLSPQELSELEANVAASPDPVFVVLRDPPDDAGSASGDDLAFRLHDAGGEDGLYLGVNGVFETQDTTWSWSAQQWGDVAGEDDATDAVTLYLDYGDDGDGFAPAEGLVGLTGLLADGAFAEVQQQGSDGLSTAAERSGAGSDDGGLLAAPGTLALVAVAVVVAAYAGWRRLSAGHTPRTAAAPAGGFVLPGSVLDRVREAGDAEAVRRAHAAVLALGEGIDGAELDTDAEGATEAWQQALDHYDAATRLLPVDGRADTDVDVLDAVGALVLAERGSAALAAARHGRPADPARPCFLNPLHPAAADPRPIEHDGRRIDAPLCRRCRDDLEEGRRPDVLDVVHEGRAVHYFETGREPWASTGFGSLDADLLTRLHGGGR